MLSGVRVPKLEGSTPSVHGAKHDGPNVFLIGDDYESKRNV